MTTQQEPEEEEEFEPFGDFDLHDNEQLHQEELADYNDSWELANEDGWFYSDED